MSMNLNMIDISNKLLYSRYTRNNSISTMHFRPNINITLLILHRPIYKSTKSLRFEILYIQLITFHSSILISSKTVFINNTRSIHPYNSCLRKSTLTLYIIIRTILMSIPDSIGPNSNRSTILSTKHISLSKIVMNRLILINNLIHSNFTIRIPKSLQRIKTHISILIKRMIIQQTNTSQTITSIRMIKKLTVVSCSNTPFITISNIMIMNIIKI